MKKNIILAVGFLIFTSFNTFAQNNVVEHKVKKGDTVTSLAKRYNVSANDIYRLNPDATQGIQLDAIIKIPVLQTKTANSTSKKHVVAKKETVYSIARKYDISPADLQLANKEVLKEVLKPGTELVIPSKKLQSTSNVTNINTSNVLPEVKRVNNPIKNRYHTVSAKETKFGIARTYNLTVTELENLNPEIKGADHLEIGKILRLSADTPPYKALSEIESPTTDYVVQPQETLFSISNKTGISINELLKLNPELFDGVLAGSTIKLPKKAPASNIFDNDVVYETYVVQPQETFYSLNKRSGLSVAEFLELNPELQNGVLAGMIIKMPKNNAKQNKPITDLSLQIEPYASKNLVLLLPFNADKYGSSGATIHDQLKNDRFANMTLDFYSGALVAIDSAKKLGIPVKVQVLDSKETNTGSNIYSLVNRGSFNNADVVIGPFFQSQVENLANLLSNQSVAIVSPLSTEKGKPMPNLYQSMPSTEDVRKALIDYIHTKNANIVAVVDPKKGSVRKHINESFPSVTIAPIADDGLLNANEIRQILDRNRLNYVILESESTALTVSTCKTLLSLLKDYNIQLVTLDKNETLESDEIALADLTKLKLLYPSVTNDANGLKLTSFAKAFKAQNNTLPNKFATRGFDVTFDTILRLYNINGFRESINNLASQQLENKFNYINVDGAYYNKGVYLLYYDTDLTIKEAN